MENPERQYLRIAQWICLGIMIGLIPGIIKTDALRTELAYEQQQTAKEIADLRAQVAEREKFDSKIAAARQNTGRFSTVLIAHAGPQPHREVTGLEDPWNHIDIAYTSDAVWIIPGIVFPRTLETDERAAWAHLDPAGHIIDKWYGAPSMYHLTSEGQ